METSAGALEDLYRTRTAQDRRGRIRSQWDHVLLFRDLDRLIEQGKIENFDQVIDPERDGLERRYFRDLGTNEIYVFVEGWDKGPPEFRKLI